MTETTHLLARYDAQGPHSIALFMVCGLILSYVRVALAAERSTCDECRRVAAKMAKGTPPLK